jgi:hypothetical protein
MLRLNIRQTFTQIEIRTQPSTLSMRYIKPEAHTEYVAPRSNKGTTQPKLDINSYPSRHSYGHSTCDDLTRAAGQRGFQDLAAAIKRHNHEGIAMANNGAKKGHDEVVTQAKQHLSQEIHKQRIIVAQRIATVRHADRIAVMEEGRIAALGRHEELLETCAVYRDIYDSQLHASEADL